MLRELSLNEMEYTILMPCLNEAGTIETCINKAQKFLTEHAINGEVLIADNGSTDGSKQKAIALGARTIDVKIKGYGSALQEGIKNARGTYIIMGDADDTYDFEHLYGFVAQLRAGYDLVMGNRFKGGIAPRAMPFLHRYLGNPVLSFIGKLFFKSPCSDFHCGLRGFKKDSILSLDLRTIGMEFASEMVAKSSLNNLRITEVPTTLSSSRDDRQAHLRTWSDGWRHLRFMLLYSPEWLFLYPGILLMFLGTIVSIWLSIRPLRILGITFDIHTLLISCITIIIGYQTIIFAFSSKVFAILEGLLPYDTNFMKLFKYFRLETGLLGGFCLSILGMLGIIYALLIWKEHSFGPLNAPDTMRIVIPAVTSLALGVQTIFASFFFSVLGLKRI